MTETAFADLRARVADALDDPTSPLLTDVAVLPDVVDSLTPPAWLLTWGDPWMVPATFCTHTVRLDVVCIAGRIEPAPGIATIEEMVAVALSRLRAAGLPEATVLPPARYDIGGVPYLAARISIDARIAVPLPEIAPTKDGAAQLVANAVLSATGASAAFAVKSGAVSLAVTATLTATGATAAYPVSTATATLSTTGTLAATGATAAWPRVSGAAALSTTGTLSATGASSALWSPATLSPGGWWDAADLATITASGSPAHVSSWANKGSGLAAVQATAGIQPETGTQTISGKNVLRFWYDPSTIMTVASGMPTQPVTLLMVAKNVGSTNQHTAVIFNNTDGRLYLSGPGQEAAAWAGVATILDGVWTPGAVHNMVGILASPSSTLYVDRTLIGTAAAGAQPSATGGLGIGNVATMTEPWVGDIAEVVVVAGTISAANRTAWDNYCTAKWGTP